MKEFSVISAPVMTFFSRPFYKDLALNGKGMGFVYLFLLLLICWTPVCIRVYLTTDGGCRSQECVDFIDQLPNLTWANSKMSMDRSSPYSISERGRPIIVFDTSGKLKSLSDAAPAHILLTTDYLIMEESKGQEKSISWKQFLPDYKLGPAIIKNFLAKIPLVLAIVAWVFGLFVWIGHIIVALFLGAIGLLMDRTKLGYGTSVRLAAFAMTPSIIISTIAEMIPFTIPFWPFLSIFMSIGFLYFAFSSVNQDAQA